MTSRTALSAALLALLWAPASRLEQSGAEAVHPLTGPFYHVQGIDLEAGTLWVSSVEREASRGYLSRVDLGSGRIEARVEVQEGDRFHPGGISLDGDAVWVPVAEYRRGGKTSVQKRDKRSLALLSRFEVGDHVGCIAAGSEGLAGGNWDSAELFFWTRDGRQVRKALNPHGNRYQDLKLVGGRLVGAGLLPGADGGAIDWLDAGTLELLRRVAAGKTDRGVALTHEGMALRGGRLYLLPEDDPTRLFVFKLE